MHACSPQRAGPQSASVGKAGKPLTAERANGHLGVTVQKKVLERHDGRDSAASDRRHGLRWMHRGRERGPAQGAGRAVGHRRSGRGSGRGGSQAPANTEPLLAAIEACRLRRGDRLISWRVAASRGSRRSLRHVRRAGGAGSRGYATAGGLVRGGGRRRIVVLGLATEVAKLTEAEQRSVIAWATEDVAGRVPLGDRLRQLDRGAAGAFAHRRARGRQLADPAAAAIGTHCSGELLHGFGRLADAATVPVAIQNARR